MAVSEAVFAGRIPGRDSAVEVRITGSTISGVDELIHEPSPPLPCIAPGFIDLQVNGFAGVDYNDGGSTPEAIASSIRAQFATGVTRILPTVITGSRERMLASIRNVSATRQQLLEAGAPEGHAIAGLHIEGPHLSPQDGPRGAHPAEHIRPPNPAEFDHWQDVSNGLVRLVTISPEWPEAPDYIRYVTRHGVVASIGHTAADAMQVAEAVDAGATLSTHLGNASHPILHKTDNYIWWQLAQDRLTATFIADGIHLPASFLRAALRAKGTERSVLITDAVMPAGCTPGRYRLGQVDVELKGDGRVVLAGGDRLAGSSLHMDAAVANAVRLGGVGLRDAVTMATVNAARAGRVGNRQRGLNPGDFGDLVLFEWDVEACALLVLKTVVAGHVVFPTQD